VDQPAIPPEGPVRTKDPHPPGADNRYVEVSRRLTVMNTIGASGITLLTMAAVFGHWRTLGIIAAVQALIMAFNTWVTLWLLPRRGRSAEMVRTAVNLSAAVIISRLAGWPLPTWFWLPFVALAFDHLDPTVARWILVAMCVALDSFALYDGVSWIYPLSFTLLAVFCSEMSRVRFGNMRDMLSRSDGQRAELAAAHASLHEAHAQLTAEVEARKRMEIELRQAQKLEAVGRLAAGVAHEINTPVQFVNDSMFYLRDAMKGLVPLIRRYQELRQAAGRGEPVTEAGQALAALEEAADVEYALENMPAAIERSQEGLDRVATIVRSLKAFAHPDQREMTAVDLNQAITSTLTISKHEYKMVADVETDFASLPPVTCHAGEVNQVILNIVVNAAHAIEEQVKDSGDRGLIRIATALQGEHVLVTIADNGPGIPLAIRDRIFEPFFTTKEVGKGTGQGLAIARSVVEKHGGQLSFDSTPGKGTTFQVRLRLAPPVAAQDAA
jgi:signal transduction histidine kinase